MVKIIDKRATGKTGRLMLLAKENNGTIVCSNPTAMREKAECYGIIGLDFISYQDWLQSDIKSNYYIDEIDCLLNCIGRGNVKGYTVSEE